uniref:Uncharacterized protein n=1 Tax=Meloidogyne javanica TaxID=6303 RepID=A0A915MJY9_MELJA
SQTTSERGSFIEQIVETDEDIEAIKKLERSGKAKEVNFGVSIKPSNKRFNKINGAEYEEIVEFLKNPKKFLVWPPKKNQKGNDSRESYVKKSEEEIIEQPEQHKNTEKEEKDDPWGNHINRWENKLMFVEFRDDLLKIDKEIESCQQIKDPILAVFRYEGKDDLIHQEFRGRMGAQIIASVYNAKRLTKDIITAMFWSMGGAGLIAAILDLGVWFGLIKLVLLTKCILCAQIIGALLYSLTPLVAETFDSLVIKRLLVTFEGGEFWPDSLDKFIDNLKDAFVAGRIAAAGSIFNNILGMEKITERLGVRLLAPSVPSNQIATSTSGAMVPLEFHEWRDHQRAALYKLYDQGFLPKPDINTIVVEWREKKRNRIWHKVTFKHFIEKTSPIITSEEKDLAFREHIKSKIEASMDIQKTSAMALNSMGIGSLLSQLVLLILFFPVHKGIIKEPVEKIFLIIVNTPTEILSFGAGIIASKWGAEKVEKWWSSDDMKNKQMVKIKFIFSSLIL